jgi:hypothetical protein
MKILGSALGLSAGCLLACGSAEPRIVFECTSPSGNSVASFYSLSSGGAAGWAVLRISVRPGNHALDRDGHIFQMRHGYDAQVEWFSETDLVIRYPDTAEVDLTEPSAGPVSVRYESLSSSQGLFSEGRAEGCAGPRDAV